MAHIIIDRRKNSKGKSTTNRRRFVKRVRDQVHDAVKESIRNGSVEDIVKRKEKKIKIKGKGLSQPTFHHAKKGGIHDFVHPGNKNFNQGDRIKRTPEDVSGKGHKGSPDGSGDDSFEFHLTEEEFLDLFFQDLELPDMVKKTIAKVNEYENHMAGFSVDGNPSRLNILQSMKRAKGRRLALRSPKKRKLEDLLNELALLDVTNPDDIIKIDELNDKINKIKASIKKVPFIDDIDLRYNRWEKVIIPTTQAVMFGIMDVSVSMGEWEKEMAKRFFMLMLLFLHYNYERVDIRWIRHHSRAMEVDEKEFFHSRETGGTIVSSSLIIMKDIISNHYPVSNWNIFGCQISDGDNWSRDNIEVYELMEKFILPITQYFAYIEVNQYKDRGESDLWPVYEKFKSSFKQLAMAQVTDVSEIYPIFRSLFEKKN